MQYTQDPLLLHKRGYVVQRKTDAYYLASPGPILEYKWTANMNRAWLLNAQQLAIVLGQVEEAEPVEVVRSVITSKLLKTEIEETTLIDLE